MIRFAKEAHLRDIDRIYNQAIEDGLRTAHLEPLDPRERRAWFNNHNQGSFPIFVFTEDGKTLGWLSLSPYRPGRGALSEVAEVSYYVDYNHHDSGIASQLMESAISFCDNTPLRILVAILISGNSASIELLQKFGFEEWGRIPEGIHYDGQFKDHVYWGKRLSRQESKY
ncbi:MAG: N-acetyltransferase family protein [Balneolaceae bacterium]|nr:N-acetyltransferase family protein [Balneolaceae bacterium]